MSLAIVVIARELDGVDTFCRFMDSYRRCDRNFPHTLIVVFKGFGSSSGFEPFLKHLNDIIYVPLCIADVGFDIGAYIFSVRHTDFKYYFFLNSFSEILSPLLIQYLSCYVDSDDSSVIGCTSSCESLSLGLPFKFTAASFFRAVRDFIFNIYRFSCFPNPHLRTNAFLIRRDVLLSLDITPFFKTKAQCHEFESGRNSLTVQLARKSLAVYVVDYEGHLHMLSDSNFVGSFRRGLQNRLLVGDNQTRNYLNSDSAERKELTFKAWGFHC